MASKSANHVRSSSLPCKSHPLAASVEEKLCNFRSTDSVYQKLGSLKDLYERVDDLFQLPLTQQGISQDKFVNEMLNGSVLLLDVCSTSRDVFSQMNETIKDLESSLRKKRNTESNVENDVRTYMNTRKRLNKVISKSIANLRRMEKTCKPIPSDKDSDFVASIQTMKQVKETSLMVFESLLSYVSQPKRTSSTSSKWQAVSKLFKSRHKTREDANEMEKMEAELNLLVGKKTRPEEIEHVLKGLEAVESNIQQIEEELECVYRQLLKSRVSLLNMHNH